MITTLTEEVLERKRKGKTYYSFPGCADPQDIKPETLENAIKRVFQTDINKRTRERDVINGRRLDQYVLERLSKDGKLLQESRKNNSGLYRSHKESPFRFSLYDIEKMTLYDHATILHNVKTCANLIETDRDYRSKCEIVLKKIEKGLIIMPEL